MSNIWKGGKSDTIRLCGAPKLPQRVGEDVWRLFGVNERYGDRGVPALAGWT